MSPITKNEIYDFDGEIAAGNHSRSRIVE